MPRKYMGEIYEGRWEVIGFQKYNNSHGGTYLLRNIYNQKQMTIKDSTLRKIYKGETTISKLIKHRIWKGKGAIKYGRTT